MSLEHRSLLPPGPVGNSTGLFASGSSIGQAVTPEPVHPPILYSLKGTLHTLQYQAASAESINFELDCKRMHTKSFISSCDVSSFMVSVTWNHS